MEWCRVLPFRFHVMTALVCVPVRALLCAVRHGTPRHLGHSSAMWSAMAKSNCFTAFAPVEVIEIRCMSCWSSVASCIGRGMCESIVRVLARWRFPAGGLDCGWTTLLVLSVVVKGAVVVVVTCVAVVVAGVCVVAVVRGSCFCCCCC